MTYQTSINHTLKRSGATLPSAIPDERLYFAGLKKPSMLPESMPRNTLKDDIINFVTDNPLVALGGTVAAGMGLYYGTKTKAVIVPPPSVSEHYADAVKSVMGGVAGLVAGSGVIKYMAQEPLEVENLRRDIKSLEKAKKIAKSYKTTPKKLMPIINTQKKSENYDIDMTKLFQN
jgi:hypothetical protein